MGTGLALDGFIIEILNLTQRISMVRRWDALETVITFGDIYHSLPVMLMPKLGLFKLIGLKQQMISVISVVPNYLIC